MSAMAPVSKTPTKADTTGSTSGDVQLMKPSSLKYDLGLAGSPLA